MSLLFIAVQAFAVSGPPAPSFSPRELDDIVSRVALDPDPLLAQILTASTYWDQIPDAANWADDHHGLHGEALIAAISEDQLPWDPSVQALLPFPSVLETMASDPDWTQRLGEAFLAQPTQVMDAVQRMRHRAYEYGYLRSNSDIVVNSGPYIEIVPARRDYIVVPSYDPVIVYAPPRHGFTIGAAIRFSAGVTLGAVFSPWGWGTSRFGWGTHVVYINNAPWRRTWVNRRTYVHHYDLHRYSGPVHEHHQTVHHSTHDQHGQHSHQDDKNQHKDSNGHHGDDKDQHKHHDRR
ncbi:MAG TPA: DUF3300 domain-containing protein [Thermoanaerobaculia bacterium]|nr:DUF3300 domain-containing protein [Thermoanaerobaculia bacterium]